MGIVTWRGRDGVAVLTDVKGRPAPGDARGMSQRPGVVAARSVEIVAMEAQRCRPDVGPPWCAVGGYRSRSVTKARAMFPSWGSAITAAYIAGNALRFC